MPMTCFENLFAKHEWRRHLLDWNEYCEDFCNFVYSEIDDILHSTHFNDDIINNNRNGSDVIDSVFVDKLEVEWKKT